MSRIAPPVCWHSGSATSETPPAPGVDDPARGNPEHAPGSVAVCLGRSVLRVGLRLAPNHVVVDRGLGSCGRCSLTRRRPLANLGVNEDAPTFPVIVHGLGRPPTHDEFGVVMTLP